MAFSAQTGYNMT